MERRSFEAGPPLPSYHADPYFQLLNWETPTEPLRYATTVRFLPIPLAGHDFHQEPVPGEAEAHQPDTLPFRSWKRHQGGRA
ncbi:hypothetical protein GCM10011610_00050 [Nocardia rhizosphaerihabitans]|uniref:Uncharacterized protein n=1 Tax=Nocardia rhizosphaerihabitans TaxID=1691570 RepID=A0ABQ2K534_9NOCA|nr:hypothetical protein GCM10011610_00050 [Nocardia rhizosphaerihabitans]